jgi:hypothetical protein
MVPLPFGFPRKCSMPNNLEHAHPLERASAEPIRTGHPRAACSVSGAATSPMPL